MSDLDQGETIRYTEGAQNVIDLISPQSWYLSSRPRDLGMVYNEGDEDNNGIADGVTETFDISTEELINYTISEDTVEVSE